MDWKSKRVSTILESALAEDKATRDITSALTIDPELQASASILTRQDCIISGLGAIGAVFTCFNAMQTQLGHKSSRFEVISHPEIFDGVRVKRGQIVAVIRHNAASILSCERVILNLMQRMSGIATLTSEFVKATSSTKAKVLDTRKTIPGLRLLDKYAVCCGGGMNHRQDLEDGILIKRNHIALGGGLTQTIERAVKGRKTSQQIEVEVREIAEVEPALTAGADALLLVQMTPGEVAKAVKLARKIAPAAKLEAADHLSLETVGDYARTGVDFVSIGALTRSAISVDLSMRITSSVY